MQPLLVTLHLAIRACLKQCAGDEPSGVPPASRADAARAQARASLFLTAEAVAAQQQELQADAKALAAAGRRLSVNSAAAEPRIDEIRTFLQRSLHA